MIPIDVFDIFAFVVFAVLLLAAVIIVVNPGLLARLAGPEARPSAGGGGQHRQLDGRGHARTTESLRSSSRL
jgi:hypothetical protein